MGRYSIGTSHGYQTIYVTGYTAQVCAVEIGLGFVRKKSSDAVVTILGTMKTGAAYVPVDPSAPVARNAYILNDCQVKIAFVEEHLAPNLETELLDLGAACHVVRIPRVGGAVGRQLRKRLHLNVAKTI